MVSIKKWLSSIITRFNKVERDLELLWQDIIPFLRQDLANLWTKRVKEDFEKIDDEAKALDFILEHLHRYYERLQISGITSIEKSKYSKELSDIKKLRDHLKTAKPKKKSIRKIYDDLREIISDIEGEKKRIFAKLRRLQLHPVILITRTEESRLIYDRLKQKGFLRDFPQAILLENYVHSNDKLPVLIGGSGREHEESHLLSLKLAGHYNPTDIIKVMYDNHDDSTIDERLIAGNHLYHTSKTGIFSQLYVAGATSLGDKGSKNYKLVGLNDAERIAGKYVHLSLDLDLLDERYIDMMWRPGKVKFEELLDSVSGLVSMNQVVALDIFGVAPFNCRDSKTRYFLSDGKWVQILYGKPIGQDKKVLKVGERKDIAPSFDRGVTHYGTLIKAVLNE